MRHEWRQTSVGWRCNRCGEHGGNGPTPVGSGHCPQADSCCGEEPEDEEPEVKR